MNADLGSIVTRVAAVNDWSPSHARDVGREYQRFLELAVANPRAPLVPPRDVDLVWHEHLHAADYDAAFDGAAPGHGTHTTPDSGERFEATLALYRRRFGEPGAVWSTPADCQIDNEEPPAPRHSAR